MKLDKLNGHSGRLNRPGKEPIDGVFDLSGRTPTLIGSNGFDYPFTETEIKEIKYFYLRRGDWYVIELTK